MAETSMTLKLQGIDLEVRRNGRGPALLMLHGGSGPVSQLPFADRLAEHFEIFAPVHPGFDGSRIPDRFDNLEDLVYLYLDMMDALALKSAVVMGNSLGGWLAAEIAVRNLERISKLILVDAVGIKPGGREERDIADVFATSQAELARLTWHDPSLALDVAKMTEAQLKIVAGNRVALSLYGWDPYLHNPKLRYRLHRITIPTLLLWGASDGLVKPAYGKAYCEMIPGAKMIVIDKAGHAPHAEQPELFVKHVLDFAVA